jgi:putative ABC transport system ATP-binding protein
MSGVSMNGEQPALLLNNVTKTFDTGARVLHVLRGIDLRVSAGRIVMLAGPSGSGKSTLLSIVAGLLSPTSGEVEIFGQRWSAVNETARSRMRGTLVGMVFQKFHLIPTLTILENIAVTLLARGALQREAEADAGRALDAVGLADRGDALPSELSGGMQQRAALARAIVGRPRLLICDEPTANLDSETGQTIMKLILAASRDHDEQGRARSVVVVTHDYRILRYADLIYYMDDGQVSPATEELLLRVWRAGDLHEE